MSVSVSKDYIFEGSNCFRIRIMLSILSGKPIMIVKIRVREEEPGLLESEVSFLKLIVKSTNGSTFIIDETGTQVTFKPGLLHGGHIEHDCGLQKSISYFLQPLIILAPFCKVPIEATLTGITNDQLDVSIDALRQSTIPLVSKLISVWEKTDIELTVVSRGMPPNGGGKVFFKCPIRNTIKPINLLKPGKIKRIRGLALATRVAPNIANRMIDAAKGLLLKFIPDVYIHSDHLKGKNSGNSPGFGLSLVAETNEGIHFTGEAYSNPSGSDKGPSLPEDVAQEAVFCLFEEIYRGGCVSSINQSLVCLYMALGQPDVSKVEFGPLSPFTVQLLKHMRQILQIAFKLEVKDKSEEDERDEDLRKGSEKIMATCVGIGFSNLSKTII
ncbi:RNA 3'-terminal phosphate cyclase-like protein [Tetranychus urticae]|uniref:RNA 3'-terminal phosphate cyclase domain-containing protein n=1 Tax=Tetranychus urticae TaxID=32264 RepID=T1K4W7_TETUR|nr:RNA 3'-terminal phosphate cyclase-like protein [Tetranychus urticae]